VRMLRLTDAFIWEDLPRTDPYTASLAMATLIPYVHRISFLIASVANLYHVIQSSVRLLTIESHPMIYVAWYPFDIVIDN
jgi:hypothetical protein